MRKGKDENVDPRGQAFFLCGFEGAKLSVKITPAQHNISGDNSLRVPPVPIPNTEVKPQRADGTWLATARESRSSPDSIKRRSCERLFFCKMGEQMHAVCSPNQ